ncbi:MAG: type VI secretion system tip protein VgrG [Lentisphaerae bacterium]|nr:type VI secretion system tip protein VgrG [Lentisphaerota bacterium]MCP4102552.1 type VI secretion system tip protein VgrG [Lentisphaerota bacterium]
MSVYTQDNRDLQVIVDGKDGYDDYGNNYVLIAELHEGSYEALSMPFCIYLRLLSPAVNSPLAMDEMLGRTVTVKLKKPDDSWRYFNGILSDFCFEGYYSYTEKDSTVTNKELYAYTATLNPKLVLLKNSVRSRVFHSKSPLDIVKSILDDWQVDYEDNVSSDSSDASECFEFEQCVQYEESDFDFVTRLLEQEGIYYKFWHGEDNSSTVHQMKLYSSNPVADLELVFNQDGDTDYVSSFLLKQKVVPGTVRLDDYDFRQADIVFFDYDDTSVNQTTDLDSYDEKMMISNYEAGFITTSEKSDASNYREKLKTINSERLSCSQYGWEGKTGNRLIEAGSAFTLSDFPIGTIKGLVTKLCFAAATTPYSINKSVIASDDLASFRAIFYAQDLNVNFRPRISVKSPKANSTLNARVISIETVSNDSDLGFSSDLGGDPLSVDSSTYRIKLLMNWRNTTSDNTPDFASMWMHARFGEMWADAGSGKFDVPRKGQEVIVTFLNGNPGQPVVVGSLYNSVVTPPIDLTLSEGIYGSIMRSTAVAGTDDGSIGASVSLEDTMPLPMAVYDLGDSDNQKGFSQIALFTKDNEEFTKASVDDASFMSDWFFPALSPSIQTLVDNLTDSTSYSDTMFFEGINMYSNKDVLNQATQSQYINAGKDIQICAAGSITLQVGRSQITIKDDGIKIKTTFEEADKSCGYVWDYKKVDDNCPSEPSWSLPSFSSYLAVAPGTANMFAPSSEIVGTYSAKLKTWFGCSVGGFVGSTSLTGLSAKVQGGFSLTATIFSVVSIISALVTDSCALAGDTDNAGAETVDSSVNLAAEVYLIYLVITTVCSTITLLMALFTFRSSTVDCQYDKVVIASESNKCKSWENTIEGNIISPYYGLIQELGGSTLANYVTSLTSVSTESVNLVSTETMTLAKEDVELQSSSSNLEESNINVSKEDVQGTDTDVKAIHEKTEVLDESTEVLVEEENVSKSEVNASISEVNASKEATEAALSIIDSLITKVVGSDIES